MINYKQWNNILGWFVFAIAATVYLLTLEPTVSYWDCGEFIASAYKLEINHPPGAPLFLMLAKVFSFLAPDKTKVAFMINAMSALTSALTVMFLFWTITRLTGKIILKKFNSNKGWSFAILSAGFVGAMAYAFSDTFWFSAVEAEVYATSSLFTAVIFWAILKWEEQCNDLYGNRWIILIAYLIGLSIGVHLLNLLAIPAIVLVFYFKKFKTNTIGFILAILISFALLAFVLFGIISGILNLGAKIEIWCVNELKMPFNSGIICYVILLIIILVGGIWITLITRKTVINTVLLGITMIISGYSSYLLIVIRSQAKPPMNENRPDNILSLINYINRDQYGETPLIYGKNFNAPVKGIVNGNPVYRRENGKYVIDYHKSEYAYDRRFMTIFPRMYSDDPDHINVYKSWVNIKGTPVTYSENNLKKAYYKPTLTENILFFMKYQIGYMYFRYFGWNFIGRQNNFDGDGGILSGNCICGINFFDSFFYGPQNMLPNRLKDNKGRNTYYFLPLLLGLIGAVYQFRRSKPCFSVVLMFFLMTGIAIVVYLNQTPLQVRERDYAYAGSFYAFAIWIGLGVMSLTEFLLKFINRNKSAILAFIITVVAVPSVMAIENWNGHDRSGRYTARDVAYNYLNSCAPDAILFTNGDNDTFPLWYLQEVESVRTDVRVVNVLLLSFDWYIDQMKLKSYNSDPLPISLNSNKYRQGSCDYIIFTGNGNSSMDIKDAVKYVASDDTSKKIILKSGEAIDCIPANYLKIPVDTNKELSDFSFENPLHKNVLPYIELKFNREYISKNELIILDILANNNWERPIYYLYPNSEGSLGLGAYTRLEGFAYRLTPVYAKNKDLYCTGSIQTNIMYNRLMNTFRWGGMNKKNVLIDDQNIQTTEILKIRVNFARLAEQLFLEGKKDSAKKVISRCMELMPEYNYPHDIFSLFLAKAAYKIKAIDIANQIINEYACQCFQDLAFYHSMTPRLSNLVHYDITMTIRTIEELTQLANQFGQYSLKEKLQAKLQKYSRFH